MRKPFIISSVVAFKRWPKMMLVYLCNWMKSSQMHRNWIYKVCLTLFTTCYFFCHFSSTGWSPSAESPLAVDSTYLFSVLGGELSKASWLMPLFHFISAVFNPQGHVHHPPPPPSIHLPNPLLFLGQQMLLFIYSFISKNAYFTRLFNCYDAIIQQYK